MKALVVFSGGMDSATVIAQCLSLGYEVETISFDYGSKHNDQEYSYAKKFCDHYEIATKRVRLDFIANDFESDLLKKGGDIPLGHYADPSMKKTVVPFQNGIMLSLAVGYAESRGIKFVYLGNHFGDHAIYPDCRNDFIKAFRAAAKFGTYLEVDILSPFCLMTKSEIATLGNDLGVPYRLTYSCYKGGSVHCGECGTCVERKEAFRLSGILDPTDYII